MGRSQFKGAQSRRVVITGGAKGIGRAVADLFLQGGDRVTVIDRTSNGEPRVLPYDLAIEAEAARAFFEVEKQLGGVDVLVCNVGEYRESRICSATSAEFKETIDQNFTALFHSVKSAEPLLGTGASVIIISSSLGTIPEPAAGIYCAAKAAVNMLTKCLALELRSKDIRVVAVAPGPIQVGEREACGFGAKSTVEGYSVSGRLGTPEEVAHLVKFVASAEASYLNGTIIGIDGGESSFAAPWSLLEEIRTAGSIRK